jgi:hypothetical protein
VAQWLFEVGAAADVRTADENGVTPMFVACCQGHLDVAAWFFDNAGAAADVRTLDSARRTTVFAVCSWDRLSAEAPHSGSLRWGGRRSAHARPA